MSNRTLTPSIDILCKLGSIAVHVDEAISDDGHAFDVIALRQLLNDPEVKQWIRDMTKLGFMPVKRKW